MKKCPRCGARRFDYDNYFRANRCFMADCQFIDRHGEAELAEKIDELNERSLANYQASQQKIKEEGEKRRQLTLEEQKQKEKFDGNFIRFIREDVLPKFEDDILHGKYSSTWEMKWDDFAQKMEEYGVSYFHILNHECAKDKVLWPRFCEIGARYGLRIFCSITPSGFDGQDPGPYFCEIKFNG